MNLPSDRAGGARTRYLEVAVDIATRADPQAHGRTIASAVSLHEVARGLGRPRTAMYRLWETQEAFWRDLSEYLIVSNDYAQPDKTMPWQVGIEAPRDPREAPAEILETLRVVANFVQDAVFGDVQVLVRAASLGYGQYPRVAQIRAGVEARRVGDVAQTIEGMTSSIRRYFVGSLSAFDAAALVWAIADGLAVMHAITPGIDTITVPIDDGNGPQPWGLLGFACRSLIEHHTTRVEGPPPKRASGHGPADVRPPEPTQWSDDQREVLALAAQIFVERFRDGGSPEITAFDDLTVNRLATEAGVTRRAIYHVWPSVTDLRLDLLTSLLDARAARYRRLLQRVEPPGSISAFFPALLSPLVPDAVPPSHAPLAFLVDLNNNAVRGAFAAASRALIDDTRSWLDENWPAPGGARVSHDALAVLVVALASGINRLRRTCPVAEVTGASGALAVEAFTTFALDGWRSPAG